METLCRGPEEEGAGFNQTSLPFRACQRRREEGYTAAQDPSYRPPHVQEIYRAFSCLSRASSFGRSAIPDQCRGGQESQEDDENVVQDLPEDQANHPPFQNG